MRCARHSRLTGFYSTAVTFGGQYNYAFDPLDNLRSVQHVGGSTSTYLYDTNDRLTSINNTVNGSTAFSYDVQGNIAAKAGQTYSFDYGNRLREVPGKEDYRYDAWGRRQRADSPNLGEILWAYGREGKPVFMANRRVGGLQHVYLYLGSQLVATQLYDGATNPTVYQTTDVQGSVIAQTNSAAWVDHFQYYDPFGRLVAGQIDDAPAYAGQVSDQNTGLSYAQQRYYDPSVGRFMSMDPVDANTVTGSNFNRYAYANDNPYRYTDPTGTTCKAVKGGGYACNVDQNRGKFTKAQLSKVNKAYTSAVNHLVAHPNTKVAITVDGHTATASAGAVAKALIGAIVVTKANPSGNTERASTLGGGLTPGYGEHGHPLTTIDSYALGHNRFNGTENVSRDLSATFIHEGLHELPGDRAMLPLYRSDPTKFGQEHQGPYDAASNYLYDPKD